MSARLLVVFLSLSLAGLCLAQQVPTFSGTVVVTATGEEQPADEACAATTVITADDLRAAGAFEAGELLRLVPGVTLLRSGLDGGVASLFVRGTNSTQTLVLFDGVRLSSPYFGGYDWSLPVALGVGRVEVVRGPYSALYGADAIGGVVQFVPSAAAGNELHAFVEVGDSGWRRGEVQATAVSGRWSAVVGASSRSGDGPLANDGFTSRAVLADVGYDLGGGRLAVLLRRTSGRSEIPFVGATVTPHRVTEAGETLAALPLRVRLGSGGELEGSISRVERTLTFRDPDDATGFVSADTRANSEGVRLVLHQGLGAHRLALGGEWRRDVVNDASSFGVSLDRKGVSTGSLFVQDGVGLGGHASLLVGARWDEARPWGGELSPRATVSWSPGPLRVWASFGRAFRAPSLGELYYPFSGNPALAPERSRSGELGLALAAPRATRLQLVAFANRSSNLIEFDYASYRFANVARAAQDGLEASLTAPLGGGAEARLAATWLDARDGAGQPLLRRPRWSSSAVVRGPLVGGLHGELWMVWVGNRTDIDPASFASVAQGGFLTANLALAAPLRPGLELTLRVDNLADRRYEEVRGYPAPPRRAMVGIGTLLR